MPNYLDYAGLKRYDTKVKVLISANSTAISNEATSRANADNALSSRITTLENAGYITKAVNDLTNYYTKSQTYTKSEVDSLISPLTATTTINVISKADFSSSQMEIHPEDYYGTGIWLVTGAVSQPNGYVNNLCLEEIVVRSGTQGKYTYRWEVIGDTEPDLSGYVPKTTKVNGHALSSNVTITASDISDVYSKTETNALLDTKVDKVTGKGLSTNDFTTTEKNKLSNISSGAQVNVIEVVKVNNVALTPSSKAVNISVPTKVSDLTNDSGFITGVTSITNAEIDALFN